MSEYPALTVSQAGCIEDTVLTVKSENMEYGSTFLKRASWNEGVLGAGTDKMSVRSEQGL